MKRPRIPILAIALSATLALSACAGSAIASAAPAVATPPAIVIPQSPQIEAQAPANTAGNPGATAAVEGTLEAIYQQVNPSVVNISILKEVTLTSQLPTFPFFSQPQQPSPQYEHGAASGFVWNDEGYIVTNNHVVDGATKIEVTFYDGSVRRATLVGADPDSDLAVVKVESLPDSGLFPATLGDSSQVHVGQLAVAIGNPFALEGTMTVGIVSAVERSLPADSSGTTGSSYTIPNIIQTDAAINPGNSGGVLVDDQGLVIGVTSAIISTDGSSAGIGFAIPSLIVEKVVPSLISTGKFEHPWLGLSGTSLAPDLAEAMHLDPDQRGALVIDVVSESPADKAGLHGSTSSVTIDGQQARVGGDVIVAIDGQTVETFDDLVAYLASETEVGQQASLSVLRNGETKTIDLTLAARPATFGTVQRAESSRSGAYMGVSVKTLTPEICSAMQLPQDTQGVLILQVQLGSPAEQAGLRGSDRGVEIGGQQQLVGGDVIVAMNGQSVDSVETLQALLANATPGDKASLTILRAGEEMHLDVTLGEY
jgi:serine protease Do